MVKELEKIVLTFKFHTQTKNKYRFEEELGEQSWSDRDTACGTLYVEKQALELIGNPKRVMVTIEALEEKEE